MADEKTVDSKMPTDDELDAAFREEVGEEVQEDKVETPVETPAPAAEKTEPEVEDHKESSKLGRKYKRLETEMEQLKEELKAVKGVKAPVIETPQSVDDEAELERIREIEDPIDRQRAITAYDQNKAVKTRQGYEKAYMSQVGELAKSTDTELHDEIVDLMVTERQFNIIHTGRPDADARINYAEAKASILAKANEEVKKPKYPGKGDETKEIIQPAGTQTKMASMATSLPSMSKDERDYVDYLISKGTPESEIARSLGVK
jgi:hypothetical protein